MKRAGIALSWFAAYIRDPELVCESMLRPAADSAALVERLLGSELQAPYPGCALPSGFVPMGTLTLELAITSGDWTSESP